MKRLSTVLSLLLFLALCASLTYWLLRWLAPMPRPVAAPPVAQKSMPALAAAFTLFGGDPHSVAATVELRGILHADRSTESVAIIAVNGQPPRALRLSSEVTPGVQLKEIRTRTVILSARGAEREVSLPDFSSMPATAQSGADASASPSVSAQPPGLSPTPQLPSEPPQVVHGGTQAASASGSGNTGDLAEGADKTPHTPPTPSAMRPSR